MINKHEIEVGRKLALLKEVQRKVMTKSLASNRLFYMNRVCRLFESCQVALAVLVMEEGEEYRGFYTKLTALRDAYIDATVRGYRHARADLEQLTHDIEFLVSCWEEREDPQMRKLVGLNAVSQTPSPVDPPTETQIPKADFPDLRSIPALASLFEPPNPSSTPTPSE